MEIVVMPQLGETVTEGTIVAWRVSPGDRVEPDDALFEVSTDKVDTEVPSAGAGYVRELLVPEGATVAIGTPLAVVTDTADEPYELGAAVPGPAGRTGETQRAENVEVASPGPSSAVPGPAGRTGETDGAGNTGGPEMRSTHPVPSPAGRTGETERAGNAGVLSPVVRRLLDEHGLAPAQVRGSGRDGRITRADVLAAAANRAAPAATVPATTEPVPQPGPDDDVVEFTRARRTTAEHMVRSLRTSAHTLVGVQVDYHRLDPVRAAAKLSYLPFVARAVVDALRAFPHLNASVGDDELIVHRRIHLGVAVDVDHQALVVPVVRDADGLRLPALSAAVAELAAKARAKRLAADDLTGGTFSITNVGRYGTVVTAPVINQPQVAILSTDGVRMTPVAVATPEGGWAVAVHPVGNLSLTFDHRAVDGAYAAAFLAQVRDTLEQRDWAAET